MTTVLGFLAVVAVSAIGLRLVARWAQPYMTFHPSPGPTPPPRGFKSFETHTSDDVRITGWYAVPSDGNPVILYICGNAGNLADRTDLLQAIADDGLGVVAFNYRGTGESDGHPTEEGIYRDAEAVHALLTDSLHISSDRIVLWGHSIGGAVATHLALHRTCAGVILESTFRSARTMARRMLPWLPSSLLVTYRLDNEKNVADLTVPVLIIHGEEDEAVPSADARILHDKAKPPKELWLVPGAGHNDIHAVLGQVLIGRVHAFAEKVTNPRTASVTR